MTTRYDVRSTSAFDRTLRKLVKRHPKLVDVFEEVVVVLERSLQPKRNPFDKEACGCTCLVMANIEYELAVFAFDMTSRVRSSTSSTVLCAVKIVIDDIEAATNADDKMKAGVGD